MASRLVNRLTLARHARFVGRAAEKELLEAALRDSSLPFYVLYIYGPGGIGKTTLMREYAFLCESRQALPILIDARHLETSPQAFLDALRGGLGVGPEVSPFEALAAQQRHVVILIDTYELLAPLDDWLREAFLTELPENTLVVMAGRQPPSPAWRADPGWRPLIRTLPLRNFSSEESRVFLSQRQLPAEQVKTVLNFTHGHPLALSLVADVFAQRQDIQFAPDAAPDVVKILLEQFVQKVPGPAHRAALEVCALVRLTNESLLAETLQLEDAHDLFDWLRGLSFIDSGPSGVYPHDLAREALVTDLRWRNPAWYVELHNRAREYYMKRLQETRGHEQQRTLFDYVFLHRDSPVVRPFFEWQVGGGGILTDALRPSDVPQLLAMVAQHEGEESADLAEYWFSRQTQGTVVFRDPKGQPAAFLMMVAVNLADAQDLELDPAVRAAWEYLQNNAPLRPGERATLFRYWMAADTYQAVSPPQSLIFINMVLHYLTTPGLAFTFLPSADPEFWLPMFSYVRIPRLPEADYVIEGRQYGVYGHDWRAVPPLAWLDMLAAQETGTSQPTAPPAPAEPLIVLSKTNFTEAAHAALRDYCCPDVLRVNPLLRSRLLVERVGVNASEAQRVSALQEMLSEAADALRQSPRQEKFYRALYYTYFQPAPTQEKASELLDVPFSTYRRHLKSGVSAITETLWQREVSGTDR
jgi:hypothetical protein